MAGPWERYRQPGTASPVIAPPDPYKQAAEQRAQTSEVRAERAADRGDAALAISQQRLDIAQDEEERKRNERAQGFDANGEERKAAAFLIRALGANESYEGTGLGARSYAGQKFRDFAPDLQNTLPEPVGNSEERQVADSAQDEFIAASLRQDSGAAIPPEELERQRRIYFPMPGDGPEAIEQKRQARLRAIEGLKQSSGRLLNPTIERFEAMQGGQRSEASPPVIGESLGQARPFVNAEGETAGNTARYEGGATPQELLNDRYRREDDPALAGVRQEYLARLGRGDSAEQIIRWARDVGIHPSTFSSISAQVRYRRANPNVPLSEYSTRELDDRLVEVDPLARGISNMGRNAVGPFIINAGDAFTGFNLDSMVGATGGNAEQARLGMNQIASESPVTSTAGMVAGGTTAALGLEGGLAARGIAAGLPRAMAADAAYGALAGAGATDYADDGGPATVTDRLVGAGTGALAGAGGSYAGYRAGNALAKLGRGVSDPSVNALRQEGVNALTVGQTFANSGKTGRTIKGVEDRIAGVPVVGDMVNARRLEGTRQFNARAFDKALEPIGGTVGDAIGEEAVERAQEQVSQAFTDALSGRGVLPDTVFERDLSAAVMGVRSIKRLGPEVTDEIADILAPYADEAMLSGEALDDISRNLRSVRNAYFRANDPLATKVSKQVDRVERAIFDLFDRQASGTIEGYQAARQAYRRLAVLEDAVLKGKNTEGVFTPGQLGQADRRNSVKFDGRRGAARGEGVFHDFQRAAQNVLPNKVPDSGTAGRVLIPLALVGGGGGLDAAGGGGAGTGLTIGTILAALYSRTGQRILTKPGRGMKQGTRRRRVLESERTRRAIGAAGAAGSAAALTGPE